MLTRDLCLVLAVLITLESCAVLSKFRIAGEGSPFEPYVQCTHCVAEFTNLSMYARYEYLRRNCLHGNWPKIWWIQGVIFLCMSMVHAFFQTRGVFRDFQITGNS